MNIQDWFSNFKYDLQHFDREVLESWRDKLLVAWFWCGGIFLVSLLLKALLPSKWGIYGLIAFIFGLSKWLTIIVFLALIVSAAVGFFMKRDKQSTWDRDDRKAVDDFLKNGKYK